MIELSFSKIEKTPAPPECYYTPDKKEKGKYVFQTEKDWGTVFKISNKVCFNPKLKQRHRYGTTILGRIKKEHPESLRINLSKYHINEKKKPEAQSGLSTTRLTRSVRVKNGNVNLFAISIEGEEKKFKNISARPDMFLEDIKIRKKAEKRRLAKAINHLLKTNGSTVTVSASKSIETSLLELCFPALKDPFFKDLKLCHIQYGIAPLLRKPIKVKEIVRKIFGCAGRQTVREFCEAICNRKDLNVLNLYHLRGFAPVEVLRKLLGQKRTIIECINPAVRTFLLTFPKERRESLVNQLVELNHAEEVKDTLRMRDQLKEKNALVEIPSGLKTWGDIHDFLAKAHRKIEYPNKPVKVHESTEALDGLIINDYKIQIPRDSDTLHDWGMSLSNCVGSYAYRAGTENCILIGLIKDDRIEFCIEVAYRQINQFSGRFRAKPSKELLATIQQFLVDNKLIDGMFDSVKISQF
jgi:hypothetical protein